MVGVPLEFRTVCHLMRWIQSSANLNVRTQVLGLAVGRREEIYPDNCRSVTSPSHLYQFSSRVGLLPLDRVVRPGHALQLPRGQGGAQSALPGTGVHVYNNHIEEWCV